MSDAPDDALDALYSVSLEGFIASRKELATRLKRAGDAAKAAEIAALHKPTTSAWAMNDLHRNAHEEMAALLDVGARLRGAMRRALSGSGAGDEVAKLQREQRDRVEALVDLAIERLTENELSVSEAVAARMRTNLTTISTSGTWGPTAPGHMSKDLEPLDMASLAALLEVAEMPKTAKHPQALEPGHHADKSAHNAETEAHEREVEKAAVAAAEEARAEADEVLSRAKQSLVEAEARAEEAAAKEAGLREDATSHATRIEELERALRRANEETDKLRRAVEAAMRSAAEAKHTVDRAARDVDRAEVKRRAADEHLEKLTKRKRKRD